MFCLTTSSSAPQTKRAPKWKRNVGAVDGSLGMMVGKLYCKEYYPPATAKAMDSLIKVRNARWSAVMYDGLIAFNLNHCRRNDGYQSMLLCAHWPPATAEASLLYVNINQCNLKDQEHTLRGNSGAESYGCFVLRHII